MNRTQKILAALLVMVVTLSGACSKPDKVVNVEHDDPEMLVAIAKARETLPQFWHAVEKKERGESKFALKVKIKDSKGTEDFWAAHIEKQGGKFLGTINNDPDVSSGCYKVSAGSALEIVFRSGVRKQGR